MQQRRQPPRSRPAATQSAVCEFWECSVRVRQGHFLCLAHYNDQRDGLIDKCSGCGKYKDAQYEFCLRCFHSKKKGSATPQRQNQSQYRKESSPAWQARDATAERFFVYILKLNDGNFYAGQTRELRERLSEHHDGLVPSTSKKEPKLVWFAALPSREAAASTEVDLKKLIDANPREIRRMVIGFSDMVRELDFS